jgi:uncharacterized membrane protein YjdF
MRIGPIEVKDKLALKIMFWFTIGYLLLFTTLAMANRNYEFLYYTVIMSTLLLIVVLYHKKIHLSASVMAGLTLLGAMHIFGGNVEVAGTRLYDFWFITDFLKYDNVVHFVGSFVAAFVGYNMLNPHLDRKIRHSPILLSILIILIVSGIGAMNEVLEFGAVIYLNAADQVGDYLNNARDLLYNLWGVVVACFFIMTHHIRRYR